MTLDKIHIVTDSTSDLPSHLKGSSITIVPLRVYFGDREYIDSIEIKPREFYERLMTSRVIPTTSQPSTGDFVSVYNELRAQGKTKIISIHLSSKLSGTVQSAIVASRLVEGIDIQVIDSKSASLGLGFLCLAAVNYIKEMSDINRVVKKIQEDIGKINVYFTVGSLDYLEKGGRIGKAKALLANLLDFRPILSVDDGEIVPVKKVRGSFQRAIEEIVKLVKKDVASRQIRFLGVVHSRLQAGATDLAGLLKQKFKHSEVIVSELGCVLGTHVGPETIGVVVL